jgi:hypothetical protein
MLADRNVNRPSYVLALLLGVVALVDVFNALSGMQALDPCAGLSNTAGLHCGTNAGWFVDLMTSGICAVLVALLLLRPHLYIWFAVVLWSFLAFLGNFVMKSKGFDSIATIRMSIYFVAFVGAGVLTIIDGQKWTSDKWARRPASQPWQAQPYPAQYAQPTVVPPPAPPATPPATPPAPAAAPPAAPRK